MAQEPPPLVSPTQVLRDGLDPTGRTGQLGFALLVLILLGLYSLWRLGPEQAEGWGRGLEVVAAISLAVFLVPATGHVLRRLNDVGWGGWWAWALALPMLRWALVIVLLLVPSSQVRRRTDSRWRLVGLGVAGVASLLVAGSLVWTTAGIGAQGMKPALLPGDLVLVRRGPLAVGPGDVIALRLPGEDRPRAARVIARGGERVAVEGGAPVLGGVPAAQAEAGTFVETFERQGPWGLMPVCGNGAVGLGAECRTRRLEETLPGGRAYPVLDAGARPVDRMGEIAVPEGFLFTLGDHRDAAQDSRLSRAVRGTGLVAEGEVLGRIDLVLASSGSAWGFWDPRGWRPGRTGTPVR
jgi:signal peptidase I